MEIKVEKKKKIKKYRCKLKKRRNFVLRISSVAMHLRSALLVDFVFLDITQDDTKNDLL